MVLESTHPLAGSINKLIERVCRRASMEGNDFGSKLTECGRGLLGLAQFEYTDIAASSRKCG